MQKEIIDRDNPHKDIGKKKYRVRKAYTAWVEYDVIADSKDEAESAVMEHCGIEKIEWADGYHKGEPVEVYASDHNLDHDVDIDQPVEKVAECVPYEDNSTVDYSDPNWTSNEFEWLDEDYVNPNKEDKKDDMEVPF
jgi:hypothetical protein